MSVGRVLSAWVERRGTSVAVAAPAGTQTIATGFFGVDFAETGGQLQHQPTGDVYDYTTADVNAETVTLTAPLPTGKSFAVDDALYVYPLANDLMVHVRLDDTPEDEEPITARVSHPIRAMLPEGVRDPGTGEAVVVENTGQEWVVTDVVGSDVQMLGEFFARFGEDEVHVGPSLDPANPNVAEVSIRRVGGGRLRLVIGLTNFPSIEFYDLSGAFRAELGLNSNTFGNFDLFQYLNGGNVFREQSYQRDIVKTSLPAPINAGFTGVAFNALSGIQHAVTDSNGATLEDWQSLTLVNSWAHRAGYYVPAFKKMPDGTIVLRGGLVNGANSSIVATLPAGYRPTADVLLPLAVTVASGAPRLFIGTTGGLQVLGLGAGAAISLDGLRFTMI